MVTALDAISSLLGAAEEAAALISVNKDGLKKVVRMRDALYTLSDSIEEFNAGLDGALGRVNDTGHDPLSVGLPAISVAMDRRLGDLIQSVDLGDIVLERMDMFRELNEILRRFREDAVGFAMSQHSKDNVAAVTGNAEDLLAMLLDVLGVRDKITAIPYDLQLLVKAITTEEPVIPSGVSQPCRNVVGGLMQRDTKIGRAHV